MLSLWLGKGPTRLIHNFSLTEKGASVYGTYLECQVADSTGEHSWPDAHSCATLNLPGHSVLRTACTQDNAN